LQDLKNSRAKSVSRSFLAIGGLLLIPCLFSCGKKGPLTLPPDASRRMSAEATSSSSAASFEKDKEPEETVTTASKPSSAIAPGAPENLKGLFVDGTIYLLWSLPVERSGSGRYRVCRMEKDGSKTCKIVFQPSFSDQNVDRGATYKYKVTLLVDAPEQQLEGPPAWIEIRTSDTN